MKKNRIWTGLLALSVLLCFACCDKEDLPGSEEERVVPDDSADDVGNAVFSQTLQIVFSSGGATVTNPLEGKGVTVSTNGNEVVVTSTVEEVEYIVSGTTTDGMLKMYSDYKFQLVLDGVNITHADGPAINIQSKKRVFVCLNAGTQNFLTDGSAYTTVSGEDMKAAFFSEGQLIFNGSGALTVTGNYKHAICSDDYVRIYEGAITAMSKVADGMHTNDAFVMDGGALTIQAATDGIECEKGYILINDGEITIQSADDGIAASYEESDPAVDPYLEIHKGRITVTTTGTSAKAIKSRGDLIIHDGEIRVKTSQREAEGIESKKTLTINGGTIHVEAYDDCINAANHIEINGGDIYCYSTANDGIDSNGTLTVTGGRVIAIGTSSPEEGFDCDRNTFKITGGTLIGIGGATSTPTANACTQRALVYSGSGTANTLFYLVSSDGKEVLTYLIPRSLSPMTLLFSSPSLEQGSYTIYSGGQTTGGTNFNGLYEGATSSGGSQLTTFTVQSIVTTVGSQQGGTPGGGPGGR
ncbi:carbohydrate-binding domain-containing protein [Parabacteroides sp. PF5-6]|uniref:carbohydrate-binding domain-containing protein n=1 Tax=Parabacteroides sp. PF5-6 TaxID=1742403 RepID=UPI002406B006|nr:carbohydrate-binding domain-containing protein [Parabacteroides sp. PF5-6]MDF9830064.1 hypothetical protein [Parabacteroides sp. PF5-6]